MCILAVSRIFSSRFEDLRLFWKLLNRAVLIHAQFSAMNGFYCKRPADCDRTNCSITAVRHSCFRKSQNSFLSQRSIISSKISSVAGCGKGQIQYSVQRIQKLLKKAVCMSIVSFQCTMYASLHRHERTRLLLSRVTDPYVSGHEASRLCFFFNLFVFLFDLLGSDFGLDLLQIF